MKKAILFAILFTCILHTASAQKQTIYCTVSFNMAGATGPEFGVAAEKVPIEMQERLKASLKKKKTYADVVTIMGLEGWEYVDLMPYPSTMTNDVYLLFRLRE